MMQPVSPSRIQAPISLMDKTPKILEILLQDLPQGLLEWKPTAERWSIAEVLSHMVTIEKLYEQRARQIMLEDSPVLLKLEPSPEVENQERSAHQCLEQFVPLRRAFVFYLHSIPSASGARTGKHPELGIISLSEMLHELANHDLGHLRQIAELYRAYAFHPNAGPLQKYSRLKP
jgi:hypothetical protein